MLKNSISLFIFIIPLFCFSETIYKCGVALGFPPYQYVNSSGEITGLDVEIAKLVFKEAGLKVEFVAAEWDFLVSAMIHNTDNVDMLAGAELNAKRVELMQFSEPLYLRHTNLFVLKDSSHTKIEDLFGKVVAGDEDSLFEKNLGDKKKNIRIITTSSKEESFKRLKDRKVEAAIAPELVAHHFSKQFKFKIRTFSRHDLGAPVSITVKKNDQNLLLKINKALAKIKKSRKIEKLIAKYTR